MPNINRLLVMLRTHFLWLRTIVDVMEFWWKFGMNFWWYCLLCLSFLLWNWRPPRTFQAILWEATLASFCVQGVLHSLELLASDVPSGKI